MKESVKKVLTKGIILLSVALVLFIAAFFVNRMIFGSTSVKYYAKSIEEDISVAEKNFAALVKDTALIRSLIDRTHTEEQLLSVLEDRRGYALFVYHRDSSNTKLVFWNTQTTLPPFNLLEVSDASKMVRLENGQYISTSKSVILSDGRQFSVEALIPVLKKYFVQIENLRTEFVHYPDAHKRVDVSFEQTEYPIKSSYGNVLFYLQRISNEVPQSSWVSMLLILSSLSLVCFFLHKLAQLVYRDKGLGVATVFLVVTVVIARWFTYRFPDFFLFKNFPLFDPAIYSSSVVLSSLGDLLVNGLLFLWLMTFINKRLNATDRIVCKNEWVSWGFVIVALGLMVTITFLTADLVQSLVADGQISFNVTNFFSLSEYSFIGFIILAILALNYFFITQIIFTIVRRLENPNRFLIMVISAFLGLLYLSISKKADVVELNIYVLIWLMLYITILQRDVFEGLNFKLNISEVLFWLFIFSISIAAVIVFENRKIEFQQRVRFAEKLSEQADPASEKLLSIALTYLDNDFLSPNFDRFKLQDQNSYLKDSIVNKNFSAYLNKFDTRIYTFDTEEVPLFNEDPISYDTLNTIFNIQGKSTSISDLKYFEKSFDKFSYIFRRTITDTLGDIEGYFFVLSEPKRYKSDALIPELFKQNKELVPEYSPDYSYGIYTKLDLIHHYNDYPFPTQLSPEQVPKTEYEVRYSKKYEELWYRRSADKVVMIVKKDNSFIEAITLFAYIFSTFLLMLALYRLVLLLVRSKFRFTNIRQYFQLSIRSQIHSTIILVTLLSFVIIGVATILFFINRYDRSNQDKLSRAIQIMVKEVQNKLAYSFDLNDPSRLFESSASVEIERLMQDIADIHGADVNLYDTSGDLRVSSNPFVYNKGVLSAKMNPEAFYHLSKLNAVQYLTEEKIGEVNYSSIYCPVRNEDGNAVAYLNIPFFSTQVELKQEISNFLVTVINLNAFIFLIAGTIALFITNRITSSFTIIGQKMRDINLQKTNQEIEWHRKDEIGELVKEYNKMLHKLDASAVAMAKTEREGAWRQMARQVAHEIKNPLTPMKLSIQYLQKAIDNNHHNVKEMTANVARTLIEQIDHLSKIASDFSQFANIGNPKNEVFDLHELIYSLVSLYESTENLTFTWKPLPQRVMVFADKTQMNRLFTNLFQNAVEAGDPEDERTVEMTEEVIEDFVIFTIKDNGGGIPASMVDKIFTPNFTTKSSGTGLGLAMSKSIAEQAQGDIWFETEEGVGTSFHVKIPVLRVV